MSEQTILWFRDLSEKAGKGVVNNIDARCLLRIARELEQREALVKALTHISSGQFDYLKDAMNCARSALAALAQVKQP